jgi:hypothetical protein
LKRMDECTTHAYPLPGPSPYVLRRSESALSGQIAVWLVLRLKCPVCFANFSELILFQFYKRGGQLDIEMLDLERFEEYSLESIEEVEWAD